MKILPKISVFIGIATLFSYGSIFISANTFWIAPFVSLLIPIFILLNVFFLFLWIFRKEQRLLFFNFLVLLLGMRFIGASFALNQKREIPENTFSVLSYNVRVFNVYQHLNTNFKESAQIINWVQKDASEILCFQEFYNRTGSEMFDVKKLLSEEKNYNYTLATTSYQYNKIYEQEFGLGIFTKYPIITSGEIPFPQKTSNKALFADIKIGNDTIRVINLHLESLNLDQETIGNPKALQQNYRSLVEKFKRKFQIRASQVEVVRKCVTDSPYKVIVCGDLNATPYSYTYQKLHKNLDNSFEKRGSGFGFTFNGKIPFLRIDNLFFSNSLTLIRFETLKEVKYSDHFPIKSTFEIPFKKSKKVK